MKTQKNAEFGFLRVAAISPRVKIGNPSATTEGIISLAGLYASQGARLIVFPELCLAGGYTNNDLLHQTAVQQASLEGLLRITKASANVYAVIVVGMPLLVHNLLFNVAVVIDRGAVVGIVPKTYLPTGVEFQEARWFHPASDLLVSEIELFGRMVPIGTDLLFESRENAMVTLGVEVCEDLWAVIPPSSFLAAAGATVIVNVSASNELIGKADYRRSLIANQSGRCVSGYVYSSAGAGESTTDLIFGGHCLIGDNGSVIAESERLTFDVTGATEADIDVESLAHDRMRTTSFGQCSQELKRRPPYRRIPLWLPMETPDNLRRPNPKHPFVPSDKARKDEHCNDAFNMTSIGLAHRLQASNSKKMHIGISGGLDSTLALLVSLKACELLGLKPKEAIHGYTMPGFGTSVGTKSNAHALAEAAHIQMEEIPIIDGSKQVLRDINHVSETEDITFENAQARYRTLILMQKANQLGGLVVGTGDLSEAALGWCTYTGDHISHYNVNCSVPKTLVQFIVRWVAENEAEAALNKVLLSILDTPISPELTSSKEGAIAQKTEDILGPYELHDFFLHQFVRWGSRPQKILYLAKQAFGDAYTEDDLKKWLRKFITRFFRNQFKRSAVPDGPKIGSVSLSPRGDWRMPSDASPELWLKELED